MPNLVNSEKSSGILPLCQAEYQFLSQGHLWVPQTWSSVERYKSVPLQSVFSIHRMQQLSVQATWDLGKVLPFLRPFLLSYLSFLSVLLGGKQIVKKMKITHRTAGQLASGLGQEDK